MQQPELASKHTCTGCLACVDICRHGAIQPIIANDGHTYVRIDSEKCVGCGMCTNVCPVVNGQYYSSNEIKGSSAYAVYCKDDGIYMKSTSGGLFAAIAIDFIRSGGYVCGVVMEKNKAIHVVTNRESDIARMQGSKYIQSDTEGIYRKINGLLRAGEKVLFCGMGCQAAAVVSYFRRSKYRDSLYVLDMICGGVPSSKLVKLFIENNPKYEQVVGYRKKGKYVLSCVTVDGRIEELNAERPLPLYGFFSGLTNRYSCGDCRFTGVERGSDMTIGDYWGDKGNIHKSVAIVHSHKGRELLEGCGSLEIFKTDWQCLKYNYRAIIGKNYNNYRWQRKMLPWLLKHLSYSGVCGFYGCTFKNPILLLVYGFTKIESVITKKIIRLKQRNILKKMVKLYDKYSSSKLMRGGVNAIKYNKVVVYLRILLSKVLEVAPATKHLATSGLRKDPRKMYTELFIRTHALEKGMSIGDVRYGFGKPKAITLLKDLQHFMDIGGDHRFIVESCSVIDKYIAFNEEGGADMTDIKAALKTFLDSNNLSVDNIGGVYELNLQEIRKAALSSFADFSQSRFSVRDFGQKDVSRESVEKALKLCERTPTACNRQSQRIHIYTDREKMEKLCRMQMGCNGFTEKMKGLILVCGDLNRYSFHELNQVFVDGGLYAMNLMYALHYYDIANIPLTMAHKTYHINKIKKEMNIPENEQPVLLIGYGTYKDKWKSAQSKRRSWCEYTCWNE